MKRVVITGLGAVTPVGRGVPTFWDGLRRGKCGINYITKFDTSECRAKVAPERFGFYYGSDIGGIDTFIDEHNNLINRGPLRVFPRFIPKLITNMASGNIAIESGAKGSCIAVGTACATGTTAIVEACRTIKGGYSDAIIASSIEASISPLEVVAFMNCIVLSESEDKKAHLFLLTKTEMVLLWAKVQVR